MMRRPRWMVLEALCLLALTALWDQAARLAELGIDVAEHVADALAQRGEEAGRQAQAHGEANGMAHDAAQHIAAAEVRKAARHRR